jgi:hypothetical protein
MATLVRDPAFSVGHFGILHVNSMLACEQALFELSLKFEREPAGLANKNASVRCLERRRVPIG